MLDFDPARSAPAPRPAATVIVLRPSPSGLEVFCVLRHQKSTFLGGAVVFPGGKVDAADSADAWATLATDPHPRARPHGGRRRHRARPLRRRLPRVARRGDHPPPRMHPLPDIDVLAMRADLEGGRTLADVLIARGARLSLDALVPWARWVTPEAEARRFDARFFLLLLPEHQRGAHDDHEITHSFWSRPAGVLDRFLRGEIFLAPPTCRTLELLAACASIDSAVALANEQSLLPVCPRFVPDDAAPYLALPGDPSHDVPEKRVPGKTRFVLRDGKFLSEDP